MYIVFIHVQQSGNHKKKNTSINEKEAMKKVDEHVVIETTEVKKVYIFFFMKLTLTITLNKATS